MSHEFRITWVCCQSAQIERAFTEEELVRRMMGDDRSLRGHRDCESIWKAEGLGWPGTVH